MATEALAPAHQDADIMDIDIDMDVDGEPMAEEDLIEVGIRRSSPPTATPHADLIPGRRGANAIAPARFLPHPRHLQRRSTAGTAI